MLGIELFYFWARAQKKNPGLRTAFFFRWPADGVVKILSALNLSADSHESIKCGQITTPSAGQNFELILSADKIKCGQIK